MAQLWNIEIARPARKELSRLPPEVQNRIAKAILALEGEPFPHGCKKLRNRDGWRIRVGDYRAFQKLRAGGFRDSQIPPAWMTRAQ